MLSVYSGEFLKSFPEDNNLSILFVMQVDNDSASMSSDEVDIKYYGKGSSSGGGMTAASCKVLNKVGKEQVTGRAASWAIHFDRLLADKAGISTFMVSFLCLIYNTNCCDSLKVLLFGLVIYMV